jgi:hypothetical protein
MGHPGTAGASHVRYLWVNQYRTFRPEIQGGTSGPRSAIPMETKTPLFPNCTVVSHCYESPKLAEFGEVGLNWEAIGRRVRVNFTFLAHRIRSKDQIDLLRSVLPGLVFSVTKVWERHSLDMSHRRSRLSRDLHRLSRCGGHHTGTSQRCVALNPEESVQNLRSSERRIGRLLSCFTSCPESLFPLVTSKVRPEAKIVASIE